MQWGVPIGNGGSVDKKIVIEGGNVEEDGLIVEKELCEEG